MVNVPPLNRGQAEIPALPWTQTPMAVVPDRFTSDPGSR